ncbi:B-cell receptor CD22-like [Xyrauchen texanus]|uniref:B-cell receptor CD22-like n=1 Tax=Xyrauchen texanus TaxID=154827 RepID=UPI002242C5A2|nr:B-cell receptor CD22-like [Xyrauchen texanus]
MAPPLPLIFLLMIAAGVYSADDWGVSYSSKYICALKGSSVIMSCTYKYPPGYKIENVFWFSKFIEKDVDPPDLFNDPEYSQRIQYLGDKQQICTIRLNDVTQKDSHEYYFRFITDKPDGRWIGYPGVTLDITDLHVESPESVTEGDTVSLTCKSTCNLTDRTTFIWWKNTQSLTERNNKLLLQSVRREDAGRYSCAVHGHKLTSPHVDLNVKYPPEIPVIFISKSGEIVLGDSVTLTCSSDSNPPAQISWFKGSTYIGSGEIYSITRIRSDHSGEYKCKSRNEVGEKYSDTVTLNVMYSPRNVSVSMSGSGEIVLGDSVTLTCSSDSNPPVLNYTWFKENESSSVGSGQSYSALQSGFFYCVAQNQHGSQRSAAVSVTVHYRSSWYIMLGVMMGCGGTIIIIFIIFIILFIIKRERMNRRSAIKENETADRCDDTYTTLDLKTRSSDDVYNTITVSLKSKETLLRISSQFLHMAPPLPLIFLLMIAAGVYSADDWGVSYSSKYICALKGSSVIMSCTYKYPPGYKIENVFWFSEFREKDVDPPDLFNDPEYSQRIQYLGDKQQICTIRLNDVTQKDSHEYYFRFITDKPDGRWIGYPGVTLDITDLHVESPESVTEGDTVSLTCKSTCNLTDRTTFIWWKNTQSLTERNNKLLLQSVRREDAGRYSCAVHGHKLTSPHVDLNVKYPPEIPVIFISKSGEIVLGDSVTLTCSSDSNPPAQISWFKGSTYIGSGEIYSITRIRSDHSGEYKCKSRNEVGEKYSDTVTLNVMYSPRNVSVSMSGSGEIVLGDSVTLTCSSDSNPPVLNYTWFKENESSSVGSGQSYSALQSGFFYCVAQNQHGSQRSAAVSVTVHYRSSWYIMLGVMMGCGGTIIIIFIIFIILFIIKRERMNRRSAIKENETADRCDDTYTTLDLKTRSSDDVYNTITPNRKMMQ